MMDCLRFEWSKTVSTTIIAAIDCLQQYRQPETKTMQHVPKQKSTFSVSINVALSHINLFFLIDERICLMTRIDAISLDSGLKKSGAVISGLKVVDVIPYKG